MSSLVDRLSRFAPGLPALVHYEAAELPRDVFAGLSVAAVALPVGVAYAELAGFNPVVGLYSSILPLFAYALFGTSRQLIIGPDAATCALIAAAVAPLAAGDADVYQSLSVTLAFLAGLFCIAGSFLRLGGLADFLSRPILIGILNGIALSIFLGQLGKLFGFPLESGGIVPRLFEFLSKLGLTHWPTLAVGAGSFAILLVAPRLLPRVPAALVAMVVSGIVVAAFGLEAHGVKTIGAVPAGLPSVRVPSFDPAELPHLIANAAGIALIAFSSMVITARSFASKNGYDLDVDREFAALGAANIASALSQGFAVSGADSRTAMSDAAGGRTQVTGLAAATTIGLVLMFLTGPLQYLPVAALGAVLVMAAASLVDLRALKEIHQIDRREFALSVITTVGVVAVGAIDAILLAVVLALLRFVRLVSRPAVELLGEVPGLPGLHSVARHATAKRREGLVIFRFNGPIVFFNAPHFKREALAAAEAAGTLKWLVIDMLPITMVDATGLHAVRELCAALEARGVTIVFAGREAESRQWLELRNLPRLTSRTKSFPTLRQALRAFDDGHGKTSSAVL
jgi:high affinity sulfate transporter 1